MSKKIIVGEIVSNIEEEVTYVDEDDEEVREDEGSDTETWYFCNICLSNTLSRWGICILFQWCLFNYLSIWLSTWFAESSLINALLLFIHLWYFSPLFSPMILLHCYTRMRFRFIAILANNFVSSLGTCVSFNVGEYRARPRVRSFCLPPHLSLVRIRRALSFNTYALEMTSYQ